MVVAAAIGAFHFTRNVALIRLKHRAGDALQAAVWERLVNLPARFFSGYTAGDLGVRAMGVAGIMNALSTSAISTIVSSIFTVFAVALLFYYSPMVAIVALGLVLVVLVVIVICGLFQVRYRRQIEETYGKLAGLLLQFINGISKLRVAAAEDRAFTQWAARFAHQTRLEVSARMISNNLSIFVATFPVVCSMIIYLLVAGGRLQHAAGGHDAARLHRRRDAEHRAGLREAQADPGGGARGGRDQGRSRPPAGTHRGDQPLVPIRRRWPAGPRGCQLRRPSRRVHSPGRPVRQRQVHPASPAAGIRAAGVGLDRL